MPSQPLPTSYVLFQWHTFDASVSLQIRLIKYRLAVRTKPLFSIDLCVVFQRKCRPPLSKHTAGFSFLLNVLFWYWGLVTQRNRHHHLFREHTILLFFTHWILTIYTVNPHKSYIFPQHNVGRLKEFYDASILSSGLRIYAEKPSSL